MTNEGHGAGRSEGSSVSFDAVLFASYGTSRADARERGIEPVARELAEALGCARIPLGGAPGSFSGAGAPIFVEAYTSAKARRVLARRGEAAPDVSAALHALARSGARNVLVQPGHLVHGVAFEQVVRAVGECRFLFARLALGDPLLTSEEDLSTLARALDRHHLRRAGEALVFVAHGAESGLVGAGSAYTSLALHLRLLGRDDAYVGSMRAFPQLEDVRTLVAADRDRHGYVRVRLVPLMLTAAAHASLDIDGDRPGSWRRGFEADGLAVTSELEGLGALDEVRGLYVAHARAAWEAAAAGAERPFAATALAVPGPRTRGDASARFPLFVSLAGEKCLVVGLGHVGIRRARMLASFDARVTAVDPAPSRANECEAHACGVTVERRPWAPEDLRAARLVVAATADPEVNASIARACASGGIPVSVASSAERSTFFFPAVCESSRLMAGVVSRGGASHELVARAAAGVRRTLGEVDHDA
ncbi:sirohydrochlorin cobaltochelatase [uncultured Parolsenella sp.]|uniref:sirohydrochlorin cobaltochelatase n=1 Tax=uncultured Parolsenella sp. TaxID=2083008 RepID=UPI0027D9454C|nr:sirohydrochlorin cobaltochelatase [uncultured Parolsenella sp.]